MEKEQEIIDLVKKGDKRAFKRLYNAYAEYAIRVAISITKNKNTAMDAVQEAFIRSFNGINGLKKNMPFKPWFYRILINECNRLLAKNKHVFNSSFIIESYPDEKTEDFEELHGAMSKLKDDVRVPLILKYLDGCTEKEIAQTLQLNINTVKTRLLKGRENLRAILERNQKGGEY